MEKPSTQWSVDDRTAKPLRHIALVNKTRGLVATMFIGISMGCTDQLPTSSPLSNSQQKVSPTTKNSPVIQRPIPGLNNTSSLSPCNPSNSVDCTVPLREIDAVVKKGSEVATDLGKRALNLFATLWNEGKEFVELGRAKVKINPSSGYPINILDFERIKVEDFPVTIQFDSQIIDSEYFQGELTYVWQVKKIDRSLLIFTEEGDVIAEAEGKSFSYLFNEREEYKIRLIILENRSGEEFVYSTSTTVSDRYLF